MAVHSNLGTEQNSFELRRGDPALVSRTRMMRLRADMMPAWRVLPRFRCPARVNTRTVCRLWGAAGHCAVCLIDGGARL